MRSTRKHHLPADAADRLQAGPGPVRFIIDAELEPD
jgi:hypothetical protein